MKNVKIHPKVHTELKTFVASRGDWDMSLFASQAILKMLSEYGHKFIFPVKKQSAKTKKL
jgi:hypothetical protein